MQKIFIVRDNVDEVNEFIKDSGKIISVTSQYVSAGTPQNRSSEGIIKGKWIVVAENGKH